MRGDANKAMTGRDGAPPRESGQADGAEAHHVLVLASFPMDVGKPPPLLNPAARFKHWPHGTTFGWGCDRHGEEILALTQKKRGKPGSYLNVGQFKPQAGAVFRTFSVPVNRGRGWPVR